MHYIPAVHFEGKKEEETNKQQQQHLVDPKPCVAMNDAINIIPSTSERRQFFLTPASLSLLWGFSDHLLPPSRFSATAFSAGIARCVGSENNSLLHPRCRCTHVHGGLRGSGAQKQNEHQTHVLAMQRMRCKWLELNHFSAGNAKPPHHVVSAHESPFALFDMNRILVVLVVQSFFLPF